MVQLIVGNKGKGKTKYLLDTVNEAVKSANGNIAYLDKSTKHMFELNNKVRLINCSDYDIANSSEFVGFVSGIMSQDHDLEALYVDGFLTLSKEEDTAAAFKAIDRLEAISTKFNVNFVLSISVDKADLPENLQEKVIIAL
ncbi:MAG: twitching motility protein PilT [Lachnospiraceae bacterium]|nr:twitching motility protein PilT [Lachnospiraceae bacterium]